MQHQSETISVAMAKAAPPVSVSLATVAGYNVSELLMWATLFYTLLLISHKLWLMWTEFKEKRK
jgi:hypothetical protein